MVHESVSLGVKRLPSIIVMSSLLLLIVSSVIVFSASSTVYEFDVWGLVTRVVDGDTVYMKVYEVYKPRYISLEGSVIKVRFADINAPELGTVSGEEAKKALTALVGGRYVYLDIDDKYVYDRYGRIVGVLYLPLNKTHALNVNLWLVLKGYAVFKDYPNEFNPSAWSLYVTLPPEGITPVTATVKTVTKTVTETLARTIAKTVTRTTTVTKTMTRTFTTTKTVPITLAETRTVTIVYTKTIAPTQTSTTPPTKPTATIPIACTMLIIGLTTGYMLCRAQERK